MRFRFTIHSFALASVFLFLFSNLSFGQQKERFRDIPLEKYLKENSLKDAKTLLEQKKDSLGKFNPEKQAYYQNKISQVNLMEGNFAEALTYAKKASTSLKEDPNSQVWGETYRALCFAYIRIGNLDSALIFAEKLYGFTKTNGDQNMKRAALVALGNISLQNKSYQKSLAFYTEALETTEDLRDSINLKVDFYNVGLALSQLNEHEKSNSFLLKAAERAQKEQAWDLVARSYGTMADNFLDLNNFEAQETYLKKANEIAEKIGNQQLLAMGYANLTEAALRKGNYNQAVIWGNKSMEYLADRPLIQLQSKLDSMLYVSHKGLGNYQMALKKFEEYNKKRLTIRNQAQKEKLDELTLKFEVEKKDLLIANQEISLKEEKAKNQAFLIGIALLCSLIFFLTYTTVKNARTRRILFTKEREMEKVGQLVPPSDLETLEKNLMETLSIDLSSEEERDYQKLSHELFQLIKERKLYLDPKINQQTIANEFGTNRQYIYELISKNGENNFRGIINRFRINEAKELMEKDLDEKKISDLSKMAEKLGFNTYATFYRAFKSSTGLNPNEYIKELEREKAKLS